MLNGVKYQVAERIKNIRLGAGLSQSELVERIGLKSQTHFSKIERGDVDPPLEVLRSLSREFNVSINHILMVDSPAPVPSLDGVKNEMAKDTIERIRKCVASLQQCISNTHEIDSQNEDRVGKLQSQVLSLEAKICEPAFT